MLGNAFWIFQLRSFFKKSLYISPREAVIHHGVHAHVTGEYHVTWGNVGKSTGTVDRCLLGLTCGEESECTVPPTNHGGVFVPARPHCSGDFVNMIWWISIGLNGEAGKERWRCIVWGEGTQLCLEIYFIPSYTSLSHLRWTE